MSNPLGADIEFVNGHLVSQKVRQVVDAIRAYDPEIVVQFIPVSERKDGRAAYRVMHMPMGREPYCMFTVRRDEDFDARILQKIIQNDQRHGTTTLSEYEAWEAAQKAVQRQKHLDELEEMADIAYHVFRSHKNTYKVSNELTIKDGIPFNANRLKD